MDMRREDLQTNYPKILLKKLDQSKVAMNGLIRFSLLLMLFRDFYTFFSQNLFCLLMQVDHQEDNKQITGDY